jgi:hypothetical protein
MSHWNLALLDFLIIGAQSDSMPTYFQVLYCRLNSPNMHVIEKAKLELGLISESPDWSCSSEVELLAGMLPGLASN